MVFNYSALFDIYISLSYLRKTIEIGEGEVVPSVIYIKKQNKKMAENNFCKVRDVSIGL